MSPSSLEFLVCLVVFATLNYWLPGRASRQFLLTCLNAGFLATQIPDVQSAVATLLFTLSGYLVVRVLQVYKSSLILTGYILALVFIFLVLKGYPFFGSLLSSPERQQIGMVVGISYLLFRQIHMAVDAIEGDITGLTIWNYLNYQFNLFGLLAGPIQRFQDFQEQFAELAPPASPQVIFESMARVCIGIFKVVWLSSEILAHYDHRIDQWMSFEGTYSWLEFTVRAAEIFYVYPLYVYMNFSGYCDIVIASSRLFGVTMPENFDWPLVSRNMIEYWTRWHRTLGFWIRDYLFTPLYKFIAARMPTKAAQWAFACYFVALFLAGTWHGPTWNFVLYGVLNGLGVSAAKLWENYLIARLGRKGLKTYLESKPIRYVAIVATIHFVCLTLLVFPDKNIKLIEHILRAKPY